MKKMAAMATLHCLVGCMVGELVGVTIGTHAGFGTYGTIVFAFTLAFASGYLFSTVPLVRSAGMKFLPSLKLVLAADTLSILSMAIADSILMAIIPGALDKNLDNPMYWLSRVSAVLVAFIVAYPVNLWQLRRGKGHALTHHHHHE